MQLEPRHEAMVAAVLAEHLPGREVWVFGSRARGDAKPYSDLDLVIMGEEGLPLHKRAALAEAFSLSDLPFRVDLAAWEELSDALRERVRREGVRLPGRENVG